MSRPDKPGQPKGTAGLADIEGALEGLLGKLGGTLAELLGKLETGEAGEVRRSATFETGRGPVRAETGIRIRVGGHDVGGPATGPEPVNRPGGQGGGTDRTERDVSSAPRPDPDPSRGGQIREVAFETCVAGLRWIASAELPGVALDDVALRAVDGVLRLETTGARRFRGEVALPEAGRSDGMETVLRNGILEVSIGLEGEEQS